MKFCISSKVAKADHDDHGRRDGLGFVGCGAPGLHLINFNVKDTRKFPKRSFGHSIFFLEFIVATPFVEFDVHIDAFLVLFETTRDLFFIVGLVVAVQRLRKIICFPRDNLLSNAVFVQIFDVVVHC